MKTDSDAAIMQASGNRPMPPPRVSQKTSGDIPLSLYMHFPWCVRKCPYCDFNSHPLRGALEETAYVDGLIRDLDFELRESESRPITSIFMGGGTPSLFSDAEIGRLIEAVHARLSVSADAEITIEANPGTVDAAHLRGYRSAGVNRVSIGVQSFNDAHLKILGRIHGREEAIAAYETARTAGFTNINLDLMFALPNQTVAESVSDLQTALELAPEHLSYYQLTLEPNTEFAARPPALPDDETAWTMQEAAQEFLSARGYAQYEISAYARPDRQSRHNGNYWHFGDYLGIGAGAHAKRSRRNPDGSLRVLRRARHKHPRQYMESAGAAEVLQEQREIGSSEMPIEFLMNALRLNQGFTVLEFESRSGLPLKVLEPGLVVGRRLGLIEESKDWVRASPLGRAHLNRLLSAFL